MSSTGDRKTVINENLKVAYGNILDEKESDRETVVNEDLKVAYGNVLDEKKPDRRTVVNPDIAAINNLQPGYAIFGKYVVREKMDVKSGEADLYLCTYNGKNYVAKIYRREAAIKKSVLDALTRINDPSIARIEEFGEYQGFPVEITKYYKNGSLEGKTFSYKELKEWIIPQINEGLRAIHERGIIHGDLKPSNIMLSDDGKRVVIIDFGISAMREANVTMVKTNVGITPAYSAPEVLIFHNYWDGSDYYSLGVTLFVLREGRLPFDNVDEKMMAEYSAIQKLPMPPTMEDDLKVLITALTYRDIRNRHDTGNPHNRWTYEKVRNWCKGIPQIEPGTAEEKHVASAAAVPEYSFLDKKYRKKEELVEALAMNWEEGKKQLFRGYLENYFKGFDQQAASICGDAQEIIGSSKNVDIQDDVFFKTLYLLNPSMKKIFWKGRASGGVKELGHSMLHENPELGREFLEKSLISKYLYAIGQRSSSLAKAAESLESLYREAGNDAEEKEKLGYTLAYMLSGEQSLTMFGKEFGTMKELGAFLAKYAASDYARFQEYCKMLNPDNRKLNPLFEAWLIAIGNTDQINMWKKK